MVKRYFIEYLSEKKLEWAAHHIKRTHPPCKFWLPPWENVNKLQLSHHSDPT